MRLFQIADYVSQAMSSLQAHEQVDVVRCAANAFWKTTQAADRAAEVVVEVPAPSVADGRFAIFGAENEVEMETEVGGGHRRIIVNDDSCCDPFGVDATRVPSSPGRWRREWWREPWIAGWGVASIIHQTELIDGDRWRGRRSIVGE